MAEVWQERASETRLSLQSLRWPHGAYYYHQPHFPDGETEGQRRPMSCLRSYT